VNILQTIVERVIARMTGPLSMRFMLQPLVAILLGIRDGRLDAKAGNRPFVMEVIFHPVDRKKALQSALKSLLTPIVLGSVLDAVAQYLLFHQVRPFWAVVVGTLILGLPYSASRGLTNRIVTGMRKRQAVVQEI
jgi:hypothetical protein